MARPMEAAVRAMARFSRSTPTERVLQTSIVLRQPLVPFIQTATAPNHMVDLFCRPVPCTGRRGLAARTVPFLTNSDGANPVAGLIVWGNILYGTAFYGGGSGKGTVFKVNIDGTGFTNLHSFTAGGYNPSVYTNSDGGHPNAGMVL